MKKRNIVFICLAILFISTLYSPQMAYADKKSEKEKETTFNLPKNVLSIQKENTFPNVMEVMELIEPSKETKELLQAKKVKMDNPDVIIILNDSVINQSQIAMEFRINIS